MELRHLRYFVAVAEARHFTRAAERLAMAQPRLSQQIKALETELGVQLLLRTKRSVSLSAAGEAFLAEAYQILARVDRAVTIAQKAGRGEIGRLRVGFVSSAAYNVLPELIRRFRISRPDVELVIEELSSDVQLQRLRDGHLDITFYRVDMESVPPIPASGLVRETVLSEPFVVAVPDSHALAGRTTIPLAALAAEPFVLFPRRLNPGFHDLIVRLCEAAGFTPKIAQEAILMQTIISLVAAGMGVSLVPASMAQLQRAGVVYRPLAEAGAHSEMAAMWRADDASPVLAAFLLTMRAVARQEVAGRLQESP
ncbi:MAG: LysR family transcriptional regulator [Candidatus Sericytochromatia bacterium]|nr:LysR family transcriptional regulator [Candidatus Sericytochromatia bacterium]